MKLGKLSLVASVAAVALWLTPTIGWSTRAYAAMVTGQVTAAPGNGEIEIAHHLYHVQAGSTAAKTLGNFYVGQNVDAVLDGPPGSPNPEIVTLTIHPAS
jgi:hypothetical protein